MNNCVPAGIGHALHIKRGLLPADYNSSRLSIFINMDLSQFLVATVAFISIISASVMPEDEVYIRFHPYQKSLHPSPSGDGLTLNVSSCPHLAWTRRRSSRAPKFFTLYARSPADRSRRYLSVDTSGERVILTRVRSMRAEWCKNFTLEMGSSYVLQNRFNSKYVTIKHHRAALVSSKEDASKVRIIRLQAFRHRESDDLSNYQE